MLQKYRPIYRALNICVKGQSVLYPLSITDKLDLLINMLHVIVLSLDTFLAYLRLVRE